MNLEKDWHKDVIYMKSYWCSESGSSSLHVLSILLSCLEWLFNQNQNCNANSNCHQDCFCSCSLLCYRRAIYLAFYLHRPILTKDLHRSLESLILLFSLFYWLFTLKSIFLTWEQEPGKAAMLVFPSHRPEPRKKRRTKQIGVLDKEEKSTEGNIPNHSQI